MLLKSANIFLISVVAPLCLALASNQNKPQRSAPDLSGEWALQTKSDLKTSSKTILLIRQSGPEVKITEKVAGNNEINELTFYSDSRGESNTWDNGHTFIKSITTWKGNKLVTKFVLPDGTFNKSPALNERVDEWSVSKDGQHLTHTSFFRTALARDASVPNSDTRVPNILRTPLNWKQKSSFKRVR